MEEYNIDKMPQISSVVSNEETEVIPTGPNIDRTFYEIILSLPAPDDRKPHGKFAPDDITINKKGIFISKSYTFMPRVETIDKSLFNKNNFNKSKLNNAKIYRYPNLSLPREKMNVINEKYNSSIIRDKEKADILVISDKFWSRIYEHCWRSTDCDSKVAAIGVLLCTNGGCPKVEEIFTQAAIEKLELFLSDVNDDDVFAIDWCNQYYYNQKITTGAITKWMSSIKDSRTSGYTYYIDADQSEGYKYLINNSHKVCWDTDLNNISCEDSVALTDETYKNISVMLTSTDKDNANLALEIMANCHTDQSYCYLAMLFFFYEEKMKEANNFNYVNFKALRNRFEDYLCGGSWHTAWPYDILIKKLVKDDVLTEFAVQVIAKKMFKNVLDKTFGINSETVFSIDPSVLILKDEYKKKITAKDLKLNDLPF